MKKQLYITPEIEVMTLTSEDIMATSCEDVRVDGGDLFGSDLWS